MRNCYDCKACRECKDGRQCHRHAPGLYDPDQWYAQWPRLDGESCRLGCEEWLAVTSVEEPVTQRLILCEKALLSLYSGGTGADEGVNEYLAKYSIPADPVEAEFEARNPPDSEPTVAGGAPYCPEPGQPSVADVLNQRDIPPLGESES